MLTPHAQKRLLMLNALERGKVQMREAALVLGLSVRHLRRLRAAYRQRGARILVHGNRDRPSPRRTPQRLRDRLVRLAQTRYAGANHQHLTELLAEQEGLTLSRPTVHRLLRAAGLRSPRTRRPPRYRRQRARMSQAGMLAQLDGSHHAWLEARGPRLVLLSAIDDATGTVLGAVFREEEDAHGYLLLLQQLTARYGLPLAVYTDRHGIFVREPREARTLAEQLQGRPEPTQLGRVLHELSIRWIPASSPQAKGRVERLFGTLQDRLVTTLRLARVTDRAGANAVLPAFLETYNARFAHPASQPEAAYRPWPAGLDPDTVFCFKYLRTVANDNTVALGPYRLQLLPGPGGRSYAQARVEVREHLDGTLSAVHHGQPVAHQILAAPPPPTNDTIPARDHRQGHRRSVQPRALRPSRTRQKATGSRPWKPGVDHPWRQSTREAIRRKQLRQAGVTFSLNR